MEKEIKEKKNERKKEEIDHTSISPFLNNLFQGDLYFTQDLP